MRENLLHHPADGQLWIALVLNGVYFLLGFTFLRAMWSRARRAGSLARMEE
jgi:hypothetical protein